MPAAPGAPGAPWGPRGPRAAIFRVTGESSYDAQSGFKSAAAACPAGKTVIGGGGRVEGEDVDLLEA